jgi:hypothetical protein
MTERNPDFYQRIAKLPIVLFLFFFCGLSVSAHESLSHNRTAWHSTSVDYDHTAHLATDGELSTSWISKPGEREWIYIDLGNKCKITGITIYWDTWYAETYEILTSETCEPNEPLNWKKIATRNTGKGSVEKLKVNAAARYVKLQCVKSFSGRGIAIREFEITGSGRILKSPASLPGAENERMLSLSDNHWETQRSSFVTGKGKELSRADFPDSNWLSASVPATVLANYIAAGAVPDPLYGDDQLQVSDWFFTSDFWYRRVFTVPESFKNKIIRLHFKGINWKADVYVNGTFLGKISGAFTRADFDITKLLNPGSKCAVAVLIHKNDNPGEVTEQHLGDPDGNGGIIGLDSPTYMAGIGWNWVPTIRGRNTGITDDVYLSASGEVTLRNPMITTILNLPDTTRADFEASVELQNSGANPKSGVLQISCRYFSVNLPVSLEAGESKTVKTDKSIYNQISVSNPKLWWPNGYGQQDLDKMSFSFSENNEMSDSFAINYGVRQYSYEYNNGNLRLKINGYPVMVRGGNWGLPEALLRCSDERYDLLVRLHKDMNLNMIRNWVGQTSDDAFYDACDRYGMMIWDDFWLANPVDGPNPANQQMFIHNATDKVKRFRNHPSIALWAGRNEGYPPATLDSALRGIISRYDKSRQYISNSADNPVTGLGPYENKDPEWYFKNRGTTFHTEQGIVCVPSLESMREMMPQEYLWPANDIWGLHDWTQPRVKIYTDDMNSRYGEAKNIEDFCRKAQMLNMEGPKAMMEAWQSNRGPGVLVWMTHPAWPSMICQTYDYFLEPTAAYFALKKGSEPVHILWNPLTNIIQAANNTIHALNGLTAKAEIYDFNGKLVWEKSIVANLISNNVTNCFKVDFPAGITETRFIKLTLQDKSNKVISSNFYWSNSNYLDYKELNNLPEVKLGATAEKTFINGKTRLEVSLLNSTTNIAVMIRLKILDPETGERILPAFWSANYFSLVPGETQSVSIMFENNTSANPTLAIEGWNVASQTVKMKSQN